MLISTEKNFIFVHVPKTGGQALEKALRPYAVKRPGGQWRRLLSHLPIPEGMNAKFGPHTSAQWAKLKLPAEFFQAAFKFGLVRNPYDLAVSRYAFIKTEKNHHRHERTAGQSFAEFLRSEKRRLVRDDQTSKLYGWNGKPLVDEIYRFETMEETYRDIVERLDLPHAPELRRVNASKRGHYREYYGETERKLVEDIWRRDFSNFGYQF